MVIEAIYPWQVTDNPKSFDMVTVVGRLTSYPEGMRRQVSYPLSEFSRLTGEMTNPEAPATLTKMVRPAIKPVVQGCRVVVKRTKEEAVVSHYTPDVWPYAKGVCRIIPDGGEEQVCYVMDLTVVG